MRSLEEPNSEIESKTVVARGSGQGPGTEFQFRKMKTFWKWMVVIAVQKCKYTECPCTAHLETAVHVHAKSLSRVQLFGTPWIAANQAPLSMGVSRQEYWSGLPFLPPGDLPNPGIKSEFLESPALAVRFFTTEPSRKP